MEPANLPSIHRLTCCDGRVIWDTAAARGRSAMCARSHSLEMPSSAMTTTGACGLLQLRSCCTGRRGHDRCGRGSGRSRCARDQSGLRDLRRRALVDGRDPDNGRVGRHRARRPPLTARSHSHRRTELDRHSAKPRRRVASLVPYLRQYSRTHVVCSASVLMSGVPAGHCARVETPECG